MTRAARASEMVAVGVVLLAIGVEAPAYADQGKNPGGEEPGTESAETPVELSDVWRSVEAHHPRIRAAVARLRKAEGESMAARGQFDPRLEAEGNVRTGGYYELRRVDVELVQPTPFWGAEIYSGYRLGLGVQDQRYPTYLSDDTLEGGEVRAGVRLPLWREGPIDERRAARRRASLLREAADEAVDGKRVEMRVAAARAYWNWVAAGQAVHVAQSMVALAETRQQQLETRFQRGAIPKVDVLDNKRALLERRGKLVAARRKLAGAAFELGLYLRGADGSPVRPREKRVPSNVPPPPFNELDTSSLSRTLFACHPDVRQRQAEIAAAEVDENLADNRVAPEVTADFQVSRDLGSSNRDRTLPGTVFKVGISVGMPLLLRTARGNATAAFARVNALERELQWLRDRLQAQVRDLAAGVQAARKRLEVEKKQWRVAKRLVDAERRRFELGSSSLRVVNLREQTAAEAELRYRQAAAAAQRAWARWRVFAAIECGSRG